MVRGNVVTDRRRRENPLQDDNQAVFPLLARIKRRRNYESRKDAKGAIFGEIRKYLFCALGVPSVSLRIRLGAMKPINRTEQSCTKLVLNEEVSLFFSGLSLFMSLDGL